MTAKFLSPIKNAFNMTMLTLGLGLATGNDMQAQNVMQGNSPFAPTGVLGKQGVNLGYMLMLDSKEVRDTVQTDSTKATIRTKQQEKLSHVAALDNATFLPGTMGFSIGAGFHGYLSQNNTLNLGAQIGGFTETMPNKSMTTIGGLRMGGQLGYDFMPSFGISAAASVGLFRGMGSNKDKISGEAKNLRLSAIFRHNNLFIEAGAQKRYSDIGTPLPEPTDKDAFFQRWIAWGLFGKLGYKF